MHKKQLGYEHDMSVRRIDEEAEAATERWLERSSITYLECAVSLMLTHMSKERVIEILEMEKKLVQEFD